MTHKIEGGHLFTAVDKREVMTNMEIFFGIHGLPDVLIRQIWLYTMKCPHDGLEVAILRRALRPRIYDRLVEEKGIVVEEGHVVKLDIFDEDMHSKLTHAERSTIAFDIQVLEALPHLTRIQLPMLRGVKGNIKVFASLPKLVYLDLYNTRVHGDVKSLSGLTRLTHFYLGATKTDGDLDAVCKVLSKSLHSCSFPSIYYNNIM